MSKPIHSSLALALLLSAFHVACSAPEPAPKFGEPAGAPGAGTGGTTGGGTGGAGTGGTTNPERCDDRSDCTPAEPYCEPSSGHCVACIADGHCAPTTTCVGGRCEPRKACVADAECAPGRCDPDAGTCVECTEASHCAPEQLCRGGHCEKQTSCTSDAACGATGRRCLVEAGFCVDCLVLEDCGEPFFCSAEHVCEVDRCDQGEGICRGLRLAAICNAAGDGFDEKPCGEGQSCKQTGEKAACTDWACTPGPKYCDGNKVVECSEAGLSIVSSEDCGDAKHCESGGCVAKFCEPNELFCRDEAIQRCNEYGTGATVEAPCTAEQFCDAQKAACVDDLCAEGQPACDGTRATTCTENGDGFESGGTDCADAETESACDGGVCMPLICAAGAFHCVSGDVTRCSANRVRWEPHDLCASSEHCVEGVDACQTDKCVQGAGRCEGTVIKTCNADGSGFEPSVFDCQAENKACVDGECRKRICSPNQHFCSEGNVVRCDATGTAFGGYDTCYPNEFCTDGWSTCRSDLCTQGQPTCNGTVLTTCKADGSGPTPGGTDCATDGKVCDEGKCAPKVCDKLERYFCSSGDVWFCSASGATKSLRGDCQAGQYCTDGSSYCHNDVCSQGAEVCNGTVATTCNADGSGFQPGGTDCAVDGRACADGKCVPKVCDNVGKYHCSGGDVWYCSPNGATKTVQDDCAANEYCTDGYSYCLSDRCSQGAAACNGNIATTCNADGSGYQPGGTDCAVDGKVCNDGQCVPKVCDKLSSYFCSEGDVWLCSPNGATMTFQYDCAATQYCTDGYYYCRSDLCSQGAAACNGNIATTCNADGSGYQPGGVDCAADGKVCDGGSCVPKVCDKPDRYFCSGGDVYYCSATGASKRLEETCSSTEYCKEGWSYCQVDVCTQGAAACNGSIATTCKADGSGYEAGGVDCKQLSQTCRAGVCAP